MSTSARFSGSWKMVIPVAIIVMAISLVSCSSAQSGQSAGPASQARQATASPVQQATTGTPGQETPASSSAPTWTSAAIGNGSTGTNFVSCASPNFCMAILGPGQAATYDGSSWTEVSAPGVTGPVSCTAHDFCAAGGQATDGTQDTDIYTYDANGWHTYPPLPVPANGTEPGFVAAVSCASPTFCVALDYLFEAFTFNGTTWSGPSQVASGGAIEAYSMVSCPSASFCAAVDEEGQAVTFNGTTWSKPSAIYNSNQSIMIGVSCASASFCVAINADGNALTFDGKSWSAPARIVPDGYHLFEVSCPAATFCMAVDGAHGDVITFDGNTWSAPFTIDTQAVQEAEQFTESPDTTDATGLTVVSCASATFCVADDLAEGYMYQS